ncbi:MAG: GNAT family N-acetyltransferase [Paracoccaceae bacterium]
MTASVRAAVLDDVPAMVALLNAIIARGGTTAHEVPYDNAKFIKLYMTPPVALACLVGCDGGGRIIGFQVLGVYPGLPENWAEIGTFVSEAARGTGIGAALFAETLKVARAGGYAAIDATIRADNMLGRGFYDRIGFRDYASDPDYRLKDGTRVGRISKRFDLM